MQAGEGRRSRCPTDRTEAARPPCRVKAPRVEGQTLASSHVDAHPERTTRTPLVPSRRTVREHKKDKQCPLPSLRKEPLWSASPESPEPPLPRHDLGVELDKVDGQRRDAYPTATTPPSRCHRAVGARSCWSWRRSAAVHVALGESIDVRGLQGSPTRHGGGQR